MNTVFDIDNLKCSGCASSILKVLRSFPELEHPEVNVENGTVAFSYREGFEIQLVKDKLEGIGYPEKRYSHWFEKSRCKRTFLCELRHR